jgi:hypothetical protein
MKAFVKTVRANWLTYLLWGLLFSLIIVPLAAAMIILGIHEGDASKPHVPELRKIAGETPVYPGAERVGEKVVLKRSMAYFNTWYKSDAPFADVQSYYQRELPTRGWALPKGPSNRFIDSDSHSQDYRRGDYFIAVERDDRSNNFSIVFIWDPQ